MELKNLKTLSMEQLLGIDVNPYFSWILESEERDTFQKSFRLLVKDASGNPCMDTGVVESDRSICQPYCGKPLKSRMRYRWEVTSTDNHGNSASASAWFETALLETGDWEAKWAKSPFPSQKREPGFGKQPPATMFRQSFRLKEKPVKVRLYATCHGIYQTYVNGIQPDGRSFAPEHTVYEKYLCYQTYDITRLCQEGENVVAMYVGDGWYFCSHALPDMEKNDYAHAVLFQIEATYPDGSLEVIGSGEKTKASHGPVLSSDLFAGEQYDAAREQAGWKEAGFDDSFWMSCPEGGVWIWESESPVGESDGCGEGAASHEDSA